MHPWPSCNGCTRNGVSMSIWVCTRSLGPITFIAPLPTSPLQLSQSVINNRCAPSCGGHKRKVRGHTKKFSAGAGIVPLPPLANWFRRHWGHQSSHQLLDFSTMLSAFWSQFADNLTTTVVRFSLNQYCPESSHFKLLFNFIWYIVSN